MSDELTDRCPRKMWPGGVQCILASGHEGAHMWSKAVDEANLWRSEAAAPNFHKHLHPSHEVYGHESPVLHHTHEGGSVPHSHT